MATRDRAAQSRKASVRAKVEHSHLIAKRDLVFTKAGYGGIDKNLNHLHMLFNSTNWLMRTRNRPIGPNQGPMNRHRGTPHALHDPSQQVTAIHTRNDSLISASLTHRGRSRPTSHARLKR